MVTRCPAGPTSVSWGSGISTHTSTQGDMCCQYLFGSRCVLHMYARASVGARLLRAPSLYSQGVGRGVQPWTDLINAGTVGHATTARHIALVMRKNSPYLPSYFYLQPPLSAAATPPAHIRTSLNTLPPPTVLCSSLRMTTWCLTSRR